MARRQFCLSGALCPIWNWCGNNRIRPLSSNDCLNVPGLSCLINGGSAYRIGWVRYQPLRRQWRILVSFLMRWAVRQRLWWVFRKGDRWLYCLPRLIRTGRSNSFFMERCQNGSGVMIIPGRYHGASMIVGWQVWSTIGVGRSRCVILRRLVVRMRIFWPGGRKCCATPRRRAVLKG